MKPKWEVRAEPFHGFSLDIKQGSKFKEVKSATEIKYRVYGTKGRWKKFVVEGPVPEDHQELVTAYELACRQRADEAASMRMQNIAR